MASPPPLQARVLALQKACDDWLEARAPEFDPFRWAVPEERHIRRKAFAEAALYLYVAQSLGPLDRLPRLKGLVDSAVNDGRYAALVRRHPRHLTLFSSGLLYARQAGILGAEAEAAARDVAGSAMPWAVERVPHRMLDLWHFCRAFGVPGRIDPAHATALSCLANQAPVPECNLTDAYALTHVLLFLHNFGGRHERFPDRPAPFDVTAVTEGMMLRFMAEDNCDIVLELLLVAALQGQLRPSMARHVLEWVLEKADRLGYVPGPAPTDGASDEWPVDKEWSENYHTVLVAGTTMRVLLSLWGRTDRHLAAADAPVDAEGAALLGKLLVCLSHYQLPYATVLLGDLAGTATRERFRAVYDQAAEYVLRQRGPDGSVGHWTDEEAVFDAKGGATFQEAVTRPLAALVADVLGPPPGLEKPLLAVRA